MLRSTLLAAAPIRRAAATLCSPLLGSILLALLIRSLRRRPQSFRPSRVQSVQNDPIPAMKAFLAGVAT